MACDPTSQRGRWFCGILVELGVREVDSVYGMEGMGTTCFLFFLFLVLVSKIYVCPGCAVSEPRVSVIPMSSERKWGVDGGRMLQAVT